VIGLVKNLTRFLIVLMLIRLAHGNTADEVVVLLDMIAIN